MTKILKLFTYQPILSGLIKFTLISFILNLGFGSKTDLLYHADEEGYLFAITLETEDELISLSGISEYHTTPSSWSIYLREDNGNCGI